MFKCIGLITFETFVLVAALFVYIYSRKNELPKWLQYLTASITIFVATLIIGTAFCCCMMCMGGCHGGGRWNHRGHGGCNKGNMEMRSCDRDYPENSDRDGCCKKGNTGNCEMNEGEEREIRIEINEDESEGKDTIEKKVIIKKTR
jgi:hypothetical protein